MKKSIIVDIDNTLSIPIDRDIYDFNKSLNDIPNNYVIDLLKLDSFSSYDILIITGREEKFREVSEQFLNKSKIGFTKIFMRKNGDNRSNKTIKKEIIIKKIKPKWDLYFAIDDNPKVVEMYKKDLNIDSLLVINKKDI